MKRHVGLQPLSHDHHNGLVHAYHMTKASEGRKDAAAVADAFLAFAAGELPRHFREEEATLVPLLPPGDEQRGRLLADHRALEEMIASLHTKRTAGAPLRSTLGEIGAALERHIRFEERELFPRLQEMLSEEELCGLAANFTGGPTCALPGS